MMVSMIWKRTLVVRCFNDFDVLYIILHLFLIHVLHHEIKGLLAAIEFLNVHLKLLGLQSLSKLFIGISCLQVALQLILICLCSRAL